MTFDKITTAGAGTMGSQVAWQMAFHRKEVTVYDAIPEGLEKGKAFHKEYAEHFVERRGATRKQIDETFARLTYTTDLPMAVRDADLISESVPESLAIKESFWREASSHDPARTVLATNTSTLAPSELVRFVARPERFLALHFAIGVWDSNIGEVMGHPGTYSAVFDSVLTFAGEIGLVPIPIRKEQNGYIINSLLVPWCTAANSAHYLDDEFIRQGHPGVASGQGFYSYPIRPLPSRTSPDAGLRLPRRHRSQEDDRAVCGRAERGPVTRPPLIAIHSAIQPDCPLTGR
jgi:3-hydroxyacyl-CoA dehydrogenase